jgi:hypothetical protein
MSITSQIYALAATLNQEKTLFLKQEGVSASMGNPLT